jgi:hypothetical protein
MNKDAVQVVLGGEVVVTPFAQYRAMVEELEQLRAEAVTILITGSAEEKNLHLEVFIPDLDKKAQVVFDASDIDRELYYTGIFGDGKGQLHCGYIWESYNYNSVIARREADAEAAAAASRMTEQDEQEEKF